MGRMSTMGIWGIEKMHVLWTSTTTTRFWEKVLPSSRHVIIQHGCRTLAGEKTPHTDVSQTTQTHFTPHSILLSHIHPNREKLWYLWKGTASRDESPCTLETIPRLDKRTVCNHDGSCKPTILEVTEEPQQMYHEMASRLARVRLRNMTHSWQREHSPRRALMPPWSWPRKTRQPTTNSHTTGKIQSRHDHSWTTHDHGDEEGHHASSPQSSCSRASRMRWNDPESAKDDNLGWYEWLDHGICKRMRNMSTK